MSKTLSESAAEILNASRAAAKQDPSLGTLAPADDIGGETPTSPPSDIGAAAAAKVNVAPKPGQEGAPAEEQPDPKKKKAEPVAEPGPDHKAVWNSTAAVKEESESEEEEVIEEEVEEEVELTEEELDELIASLSEEELVELLSELETLEEEKDKECEKCEDEDEEDEEDEDEEDEDKKKEVKEEVELSEEEILAARKEALKQTIDDNMGSCKEDVDALFNGEELSEEFKEKATTIFEAAVRARVEVIAEKVVEENESILAETITQFEEETLDKVDEYMNYVVEQWMEDNKLEVESGLRVEIAEDFINGLKNLFMEHYIEVPEEKVDIVEEMAESVVAMEEQLSNALSKTEELQKELNESKAKQVLASICEGLTSVQAEKIKALAEGVDFTTEGEYRQKLAVIRENYFPTNKKIGEKQETLVETGSEEDVGGAMDYYVKSISNQVKK